MKKILFYAVLFLLPALLTVSCQKEKIQTQENEVTTVPVSKANHRSAPPFNLEVILRGSGKSFGLVKFRQDNDVAKIIALDTRVRDLDPNHSYRLQRAVDAINVVDGNCTSTSWLTLGNGLTPQNILTDDDGTGSANLWRSVAMLATGSSFDIHFRVIDAVTSTVVLTSDCYNYTVR